MKKLGSKIIKLAAIRLHPLHFERQDADYSAESIEEMASSIEENSMINAPTVTPHKEGRTTFYLLLAGKRRWLAHRASNLSSMRCEVIEGTDYELEMQSLDENLKFKELSIPDRDRILNRRAKLLEERYPKKGPTHKATRTVAEAVKAPVREVQKARRRDDNLAKPVKQALGKKKITKEQADSLAGMDPEDQVRELEHLEQETERETRDRKKADTPKPKETPQKQALRLLRAVNATCKKVLPDLRRVYKMLEDGKVTAEELGSVNTGPINEVLSKGGSVLERIGD